jgi:uncharacterized protein (DUF697 family)/GTPase SAR1 family protein
MLPKKLKENRQNLLSLWQNFDWEQTREGVHRESRARILLLGLAGAGKSTLLNQLCGWTVSEPKAEPVDKANSISGLAGLPAPAGAAEDFGLFCLVDLPPDLDEPGRVSLIELSQSDGYAYGVQGNGPELNLDLDGVAPMGVLDPLELANMVDLLVYVLDGAAGVQAADYRWVGRLRRLGVPLLVVLNKSDLIAADLASRQAEIEARLATNALPISALAGTSVSDQLLPKMINVCPNLIVALGRELPGFRSQAAERLIRRAALVNALVALEPLPLLDLPIQIITLTGLVLRIAAIYDRPPSDVRRREVVAAVAGGFAGRYAAQQAAKLVPVAGWLISCFIGWSCSWGLGRAAVAYVEAGGDAAVDRGWNRTKGDMARICRRIYGSWQRRPRLRVVWEQRRLAAMAQRVNPAAGPQLDETRVETPAGEREQEQVA